MPRHINQGRGLSPRTNAATGSVAAELTGGKQCRIVYATWRVNDVTREPDFQGTQPQFHRKAWGMQTVPEVLVVVRPRADVTATSNR